jgi:hypothetical protein
MELYAIIKLLQIKVECLQIFRPHLRWGTQEMIWPIKKETLERGSTERLDLLALPKVNFMKGDKVNRFVILTIQS